MNKKLEDFIARCLPLLTKLFITAAIIAILVTRIDWREVADLAGGIHGLAWCIAVFFMGLQICALAWRWVLLVSAGEVRLDYPASLRITLASLLANFLLITSISGVFVRIGLTMQHGLSFLRAVCAAAADRFMTLLALLLLAALFMPRLQAYVDERFFNIAGFSLAALLIAMLALAPVLLSGFFNRIIAGRQKMTAIAGFARALLSNGFLLPHIVIVSLAGQICYFAAVCAIAAATGVEAGLIDLFSILPLIALAASLPVSLGGWGIREGAFIYGLGLLGVPMEQAFLISIQIGLLSMAAAMAAGIPAVLTGSAFGQLGRAAAQAASQNRDTFGG